MSKTTDLVPRKTVLELVTAYKEGVACLGQGLALLKDAQAHFEVFNSSGNHHRMQLFTYNEHSIELGRKLPRLKVGVWQYLVARTEIKKFASIARAREIDRQLMEEDANSLPDITFEAIMDWLASMAEYSPTMLEEAVKEVYNLLRPHGWKAKALKTNNQFKVKEKVILTHVLDADRHKYFKDGKHYVCHRCTDDLRALDNVMHLLDGKPTSAYWSGDLYDAIQRCEGGVGETEYFEFKCFMNGNLHLRFKRMDLVERINQIGGGNALPNPEKD